jgi:hypothetical protein
MGAHDQTAPGCKVLCPLLFPSPIVLY